MTELVQWGRVRYGPLKVKLWWPMPVWVELYYGSLPDLTEQPTDAKVPDMTANTELDEDRCLCVDDRWGEDHPCPFLADVHDDTDTLCSCCPWCEANCAMEI